MPYSCQVENIYKGRRACAAACMAMVCISDDGKTERKRSASRLLFPFPSFRPSYLRSPSLPPSPPSFLLPLESPPPKAHKKLFAALNHFIFSPFSSSSSSSSSTPSPPTFFLFLIFRPFCFSFPLSIGIDDVLCYFYLPRTHFISRHPYPICSRAVIVGGKGREEEGGGGGGGRGAAAAAAKQQK